MAYKTFFAQEMYRRGFLASNAFYTSFAHSPEMIDRYLDAADTVFGMMEQIRNRGETVAQRPEGSVAQSGFERLN